MLRKIITLGAHVRGSRIPSVAYLSCPIHLIIMKFVRITSKLFQKIRIIGVVQKKSRIGEAFVDKGVTFCENRVGEAVKCAVAEEALFELIVDDVEKDAIDEMDSAEAVPSILKKSHARHLVLNKLTVSGSKQTTTEGTAVIFRVFTNPNYVGKLAHVGRIVIFNGFHEALGGNEVDILNLA